MRFSTHSDSSWLAIVVGAWRRHRWCRRLLGRTYWYHQWFVLANTEPVGHDVSLSSFHSILHSAADSLNMTHWPSMTTEGNQNATCGTAWSLSQTTRTAAARSAHSAASSLESPLCS